MKCYKHNDRDAVSQCVSCSKALCPECTAKYKKPYCDECVIEEMKKNRMTLIMNSLLMIGVFVFSFLYIFEDYSLGSRLILAFFFSGFPWGWSALSMITSNLFLFMPLIGWLIYFFIKFMLSVLIGIFIMPIKIYQIVSGLIKSGKMIQYATEQ